MIQSIRAFTLICLSVTSSRASGLQPPPVQRGYSIPLIDLADQKHRQVVVDREQGQYLGHPTTVLLEEHRRRAQLVRPPARAGELGHL